MLEINWICEICFWEDEDHITFETPDIPSVKNRNLTVRQARANFERIDACDDYLMGLGIPGEARLGIRRVIRQLPTE